MEWREFAEQDLAFLPHRGRAFLAHGHGYGWLGRKMWDEIGGGMEMGWRRGMDACGITE